MKLTHIMYATCICLSLNAVIHTMDGYTHKEQQHDAAEQQDVTLLRCNQTKDPSLTQSMAAGALAGAMKYACGITNDEPSSLKGAAVKGAVEGAAQGLRRAYVLLRHLQS